VQLDLQRLTDCIEHQTEPEPFSGVVYLTQGDEVLLEGAYGDAIRTESIPNTARTRFQMASGCKVFTSVAVCQLVEQGKLAFDTPLRECVDATLPNGASGVTVRHLLTHSSGITSYFEEDIDPDYEALWKGTPMYTVRGPRDFLPLFPDKPARFAPGARFEYNDGGYILLGLAIECITGTPFAAYVQANVLEPAGVADSGYFFADQLPGGTAYAYIRNPDGTWRTNVFAIPIVGGPDGGAYTTAPDMAQFWKALMGKTLLSDGMAALFLDAQIATSSKPPSTH